MLKPIKYVSAKNELVIIDQRQLPSYSEISLTNFDEVISAIETMAVRGAPTIGITGAFGIVIGFYNKGKLIEPAKRRKYFGELKNKLLETRETAVNLSWASEKMEQTLENNINSDMDNLLDAMIAKASEIQKKNEEANKKIGTEGVGLLNDKPRVLTHCNAGALATGGYGTALGIVRTAQEQGKEPFVWVDETRPRFQGSKINAWELEQLDIPYKIIIDSAASSIMGAGKVDAVITGADRIALNGDTANKIGTYGLAILANKHNLPFYIAAPSSTIDRELESGKQIPIEERDSKEIATIGNEELAPSGADFYNPAFDITPHEFISQIITEEGIFEPNNIRESI